MFDEARERMRPGGTRDHAFGPSVVLVAFSCLLLEEGHLAVAVLRTILVARIFCGELFVDTVVRTFPRLLANESSLAALTIAILDGLMRCWDQLRECQVCS
jgi:hypothetical protein